MLEWQPMQEALGCVTSTGFFKKKMISVECSSCKVTVNDTFDNCNDHSMGV